MRKILPALLFVSLCAGSINARQLTPQEALSKAGIATGGNNEITLTDMAAEPRLCYTMEQDGVNTVYVFNRGESEGYMVLAADDACGHILLGYSGSGKFEPDNIPANMQWWLGQYGSEILYAAKLGTAAADSGNTVNFPDRRISPLLTTEWGQSEPYNELCPVIDGERCPTGCVATAMAQVMKRWSWPEHGTGSHSYVPASLGRELSVDFSERTYRWNLMADSYGESSSAESITAVATLMYDCGVSVEMNYRPGVSGSDYLAAANSLIDYFDYDKGVRCLGRDYFGIEDWIEIVCGELAAGRPVLYSGSNDEGGHAFVCDGYDGKGYFHINWGWKGYSDGYFLLTALNPSVQGIGGSTGGYNINQSMIVGIQPPVAGSDYIPVLEFVSDFSVQKPDYDRNIPQDVVFLDRRGVFNRSVGDTEVTLGLKLVAADSTVSYLACATSENMVPGSAFVRYSIVTSEFPASGSYTVTPAVRDRSGNWYDMYVRMSNVRELHLDATPARLEFTPVDEPRISISDMAIKTPLYRDSECALTASITNIGSEEYYEEVTPVLVKDGKEESTGSSVAVDLLAGDTQMFEWVTAFSPVPDAGEYELYLVDSSGKAVSKGLAVTVEDKPKASIDDIAGESQEVGLYPNPAQSDISVTSPRPIHRIEIYSISGSEAAVSTYSGNSTAVTLNISHLPAGLYLVRVVSANGSVSLCKLLKE